MAKTFADALQKQLDLAGMTGYRLSQLIGVSKQTVSKLLQGKLQPGWSTVWKITKALDVPCQVFITDDLKMPDPPEVGLPGRPAADEKPAKRVKK